MCVTLCTAVFVKHLKNPKCGPASKEREPGGDNRFCPHSNISSLQAVSFGLVKFLDSFSIFLFILMMIQ